MNRSSPNRASLPPLFPTVRPARRRSSTAGQALIIVLGMLTLVAVLMVAFLNSASTELRSAKTYAVGLDARALTDSAVNIVISQLQDATSTPTYAWASQPGMVRTYDTSGAAVTCYKLYSSSQLRVAGAFNAVTSVATEVPSTWASLPDQYTDLNSPVVVSESGTSVYHYPIINPAAVATTQSTGPLSSSPAAMDSTAAPIQGCYIDTTNPDAGICTAAATASPTTNPVPMPVAWMYVLQDGTLASMSSSGTITTTSGGSPTTANPVVGRMAFWTDDESCKVNINTSGEGTFWGRPHAASNSSGGYEQKFLGYTLPAQDEFQRYPGHPAMTSLSVIFPPAAGESIPAYNESIYGIIPRLAAGLGTSLSGTSIVTVGSAGPPVVAATPTPVPNANHLFNSVDELLFSAAATTPRTLNWNPNSAGTTAPTTATPVTPTTTFTESQIEKARFFLTANSRSPEVNMFNKPRITLWPLQINTVNKGIVTAAPACWTAKDQLIAFCSTIGKTPYYFQRYNSYDAATATLGGSVRTSAQTYPQSLKQTPIPSSQSPTLDWTLNAPGTVNRNQTLFTYLQYLTSNPIPGLGGSLSGTSGTYKYTTSVRDQILTEMIDFIRSEVTTASVDTSAPTLPSYFYAPGQTSGGMVSGERQVVPLVITPPTYPGNGVPYTSGIASYQTKGFGRFETIQQAAFVFYRLDPPTGGSQNTTPVSTPYTPSAAAPINIGVVLLLDPWNSVPGSRPWCENMRVQVTLNPVVTGSGHTASSHVMQVNSADLNGTATTAYNSTGNVPTNNATNGLPFMTGTTASTTTLLLDGFGEQSNASAMMGPEFFFYYNTGSGNGYKTLGPTTVGSATEDAFYPLYGSFTLTAKGPNVTGSAPDGTFSFTPPASITIKIYSGYDPGVTATSLAAETPVQTITMPFPAGTNPLPIPTAGTGAVPNSSPVLYFYNYNNRVGGMDWAFNHSVSPFITGGDSARSVEARYGNNTATPSRAYPAMGDLRVFSALTSVPQDYFDSYGAPSPASYPSNSSALQGSDDAGVGSGYTTTTAAIDSLRMYPFPGSYFLQNSETYGGWTGPYGSLIGTAGSGYLASQAARAYVYPCVVRGLSSTQVVLSSTTHPGDWDTGPGNQPDGPYINKPDETNSAEMFTVNSDGGLYASGSPEYNANIPEEQGNTYSPNRLISSAVAFGSLPTGIDPANPDVIGTGAQSNGGIRPWQTLLFCPNPASEASNATGTPYHPGFGSNGSGETTAPPYTIPPDSAFLDFFTMPIVEPYAISEPFSTAGKVNMNYQIVPFTYLVRDTAVRAVLKSARMMAMPASDAAGDSATWCYKLSGAAGPPDYRYTINPDEVTGTLAGFQNRFSTGDIFRSASEICNLYLVPQYLVNWNSTSNGETITATTAAGVPTAFTSSSAMATAMNNWWKNYTLTGDNVREEPYGYIYPRLTTKSNAFTVHVRVQTLQKAPNTAANQFVDNQDQVTSEYRGSYIVQRYLDPNSDSLITSTGAAGTETDPNSMVGPYKYRVVATKRFAP